MRQTLLGGHICCARWIVLIVCTIHSSPLLSTEHTIFAYDCWLAHRSSLLLDVGQFDPESVVDICFLVWAPGNRHKMLLRLFWGETSLTWISLSYQIWRGTIVLTIRDLDNVSLQFQMSIFGQEEVLYSVVCQTSTCRAKSTFYTLVTVGTSLYLKKENEYTLT